MKLPKELPLKPQWRYVDELNGRGLDLSYPKEVIKGIKRIFMNADLTGMSNLLSVVYQPYTVFINQPQDNIPYEATLAPPVYKSMKSSLQYEWKTNVGTTGFGPRASWIPTTEFLLDQFLNEDKYFSMCIALDRELPRIVHSIRIGNYRFAAMSLAGLTDKYNMEIIKLVNDYFNTHKFYSTEDKCWYSYYIVNNRSYIASSDVYVAVLIYRYRIDYDIADTQATLMYENYDVLTMPDKDHQIKRGNGKSFLQDCKKIALLKRELTHSNTSILEFHDLIRYGGYNDKILSIDNVNHVSEIFGHRAWLKTFFVALALYCDNYIDIEAIKQMDIPEHSKELVDLRKLNDLDLFVKVVEYYDSIYDSLIAD